MYLFLTCVINLIIYFKYSLIYPSVMHYFRKLTTFVKLTKFNKVKSLSVCEKLFLRERSIAHAGRGEVIFNIFSVNNY